MDIALVYDADAKAFDLAIEGGDLMTDSTLETAVLLSLYADRRALPEDVLPADGIDRRGWWCDAYSERLQGSRLWLLSREKDLATVLRRAELYAKEALAWVLEDGIAETLEVEAVHLRAGVLQLIVVINRKSGGQLAGHYEYVWGSN